MKKILLALLICVICFDCQSTFAQIGLGGSPSAAAVLDLKSPNNDKVFLPPRLTTAQRTSISNPPQGGLVFDTDKRSLYVFDGKNWTAINSTILMHDTNNY